MLGVVTRCQTAILTFNTNGGSVSAWTQPFFGIVATTANQDQVQFQPSGRNTLILLSRMNEEIRRNWRYQGVGLLMGELAVK